MKINVFLSLAVVILIGASVGGYFFHSMTKSQDAGLQQTLSGEIVPEPIPMKQKRYVVYSPQTIEQKNTQRRVLFFFANWCPTCKPADVSFATNESQIPADVTLIRVNYNDSDTDQTEKDLAKKYGITYQHTFVQIDPEGKEIAKWNGGSIEELVRNLKE